MADNETVVNKGAKAKKEDKNIVWKFEKTVADKDVSYTFSVDEEVSALCNTEKRFTFVVRVYKAEETYEERLEIKSLRDGKPNGTIVTCYSNLAQDFSKFEAYGVIIGQSYLRDLRNLIMLKYPEMEFVLITDDNLNGNFKDFITVIKEYVEKGKDLITKDFCYVPVNEFNELAGDCDYRDYEIKALRAKLAKGAYIQTVGSRYAILARIKDRPERVIAFHREKLGVELPKKKEKPQTSTQGESGTDEKA